MDYEAIIRGEVQNLGIAALSDPVAVALHPHNIRAHRGKVNGDDGHGHWDIEFPTVGHAANWVDHAEVEHVVKLRGAVQRFDTPCVVQVRLRTDERTETRADALENGDVIAANSRGRGNPRYIVVTRGTHGNSTTLRVRDDEGVHTTLCTYSDSLYDVENADDAHDNGH